MDLITLLGITVEVDAARFTEVEDLLDRWADWEAPYPSSTSFEEYVARQAESGGAIIVQASFMDEDALKGFQTGLQTLKTK